MTFQLVQLKCVNAVLIVLVPVSKRSELYHLQEDTITINILDIAIRSSFLSDNLDRYVS